MGLDLCQYRMYSAVPYVENLLALFRVTLDVWRGSFMVHADAIFWNRATIPEQFRYVNQLDSDYWCEKTAMGTSSTVVAREVYPVPNLLRLQINGLGSRSAAREDPWLLL